MLYAAQLKWPEKGLQQRKVKLMLKSFRVLRRRVSQGGTVLTLVLLRKKGEKGRQAA